jgi:hypothetical protein
MYIISGEEEGIKVRCYIDTGIISIISISKPINYTLSKFCSTTRLVDGERNSISLSLSSIIHLHCLLFAYIEEKREERNGTG